MTGLLHPVGPRSAATYWLRRALVLGVLAAVIALVVALLTPAPRRQAIPAAAPSSPAVQGTALTATPEASPDGTQSPSPSTSAPSGSPSDQQTATASSAATAKPSAQPSVAKPRPKAPVSCAPARLRVTLTGPSALKPSQPGTFVLSLINGSGARCLARVTGETFELRIYSGLDRIWSSSDCPTAVKPLKKQLAAEQAIEWRMTWNGRRSAPKCASRPETPRPGTYIATAELSRAEPVQRRVILRG